MLDMNERLAVQFIRHAIAILRHEFTRGIDAPDFERVSVRSGPLWNNWVRQRELRNALPLLQDHPCRASQLATGSVIGTLAAHRDRCATHN
jgi:hypothetical protein